MIQRLMQWFLCLMSENWLPTNPQVGYGIFDRTGRFIRFVRSGNFDHETEEYISIDLVYRQHGVCVVGDLRVIFSWTLRIDESVVISLLSMYGIDGTRDFSAVAQKKIFFDIFQDALFDLLDIENATSFRMFHVMDKKQITDQVCAIFQKLLQRDSLLKPTVVDLDIRGICFWS